MTLAKILAGWEHCLKLGRSIVFGCFSFKKKNWLKQIVFGIGEVLYYFKALSIVILKTLNFQNFFAVSVKTGLKCLIFS